MSQRLRDLIGTELDFLTFYISGATPTAVLQKIDSLIDTMTVPLVQKLCNVSLLAAASNRAIVMNYITKAENADLSRFLKENYYVHDHVNFSHLNLFGHMLLAGNIGSARPFIAEFRKRMGARSIWECNFNRCDLSDAQKKILSDMTRRITADQALVPSRKLVLALAAKIAPPPPTANVPKTDSSATAVPSMAAAATSVMRTSVPPATDKGVKSEHVGSSSQGADNVEILRAREEAEKKVKQEESIGAILRVDVEARRAAEAAKKAAEEESARLAKEQADREAAEAAAKQAADLAAGLMPKPLAVIEPHAAATQETSADVHMEEATDVPPATEPKDAPAEGPKDVPITEQESAAATEQAEEAAKKATDEKETTKKKEIAALRKSARIAEREAKAAERSGSGSTEATVAGKRKAQEELKTVVPKLARTAPRFK